MKTSVFKLVPLAVLAVGASLPLGLAQKAAATENVPHAPFAAWADLPAPGQLVAGLFYDESESYHIWANGGQRYNVNTSAEGEDYGIDINQGYLTFQYGFNEKWAADLNVGATTTGWRTFSNDGSPGSIRSTTGLMDLAFGVRYQIFNEATDTNFAWMPTLTFRAGAVLPGSYSQNFPFAPGVRSAAIEPEFLIKKHFGWTGFGSYGDALYRWNRTTGNDQVIVAFGLLQQIKGWELDAGYRHLQTLNGTSLEYDSGTQTLSTSDGSNAFSAVREDNDSIEAGFSYTTTKRHIKYSFYTRTVFAGNNSDQKFWIGGGLEMPFQLFKRN
jgi:hypothetical protein